VDPASAWLQFVSTATDGSWSQMSYLPAAPALAGLEFTAQAVFLPAGAGLGFELTNALRVTLGYDP
jgi:hypothetical protein